VRESVQTVLQPLREKGLVLDAALPDAPVVVLANDEALRRIAGNLLDNAVKYTPTHGQVRVRVLARDRSAFLEVEDTGPGIPERDRERVFERFYRVDKGRARDEGGTGLGLALVKHATRLHGGRVDLQSQLGIGSTFRVQLPLDGPGPSAN
jgi:two-component system phosphate regulon sensor histidine kinase PhoR